MHKITFYEKENSYCTFDTEIRGSQKYAVPPFRDGQGHLGH